MQLHLGERVLTLDRPRVMGVLNTTPDSFSDGGRYSGTEDAIQHAADMLGQGADIIDVGGESTRPGAPEISAQEELDRTIPVVENIFRNLDVAISIDTSKPEVMRAAVAAGASLVNDIFALRKEGALATVLELDVAVVLMHMQGDPRSMQNDPVYEELPGDVIRFLSERIDACVTAGILRDRLLVDPGFGFGKTDQHNLEILAKLALFADLGAPLLVGLSRKHTLGKLTDRPTDQREYAGAAVAVLAVERGANIVRTHDVASVVDALKVADAVRKAGKEL